MIKCCGAPDFLAVRFRDLRPSERIEVRLLGAGGAVERDWFDNPCDAAAFGLAASPRWAVYYGVCPRRNGGGKKADVTSIPALWADVDDKRFTDGRTGAQAALASFPLAPTLVVDSGGGLQPYWHLVAPLAIGADDAPLVQHVEDLLRRLYARLGGLDAVQDLSRILRLPGTYNRKPEYGEPRPVTVIHHDPAALYRLEDFERLLPAPVEPPRPRPTIPAGATAGHGLPSLAEVRELLSFIPHHGDYKEHWITVLAAVHSAYPGPEGEAVCEEWSPGHPGEVARKFRSFGRYRGQRGPAGVGTLYHLAKLHGWRSSPATRFRLQAKEVGYGRI